MKNWQIICVAVFIISILISRKASVFKIVAEQFKIHKDDRTGNYYWLDIITFIIAVPFQISFLKELKKQ